MSRQELAEAVNAYLWHRYGRQEHLDHTDIGKLERGRIRWPGEQRRDALRAVLGVASDAKLGLYVNRLERYRATRAAEAPPASGGAATGQEVEETNRRNAMATALGFAGGSIVRAPEHGGVSMLSLLSSLPPDPDELEPGLGNDGVAAYGELSQRLWRLYWNAPARPLFDAAYAQVRLGADMIRGASGVDRVRLTTALALSALLSARLAFFDLNRPAAASRFHQVALAAADEGGDQTMVAVVLGHAAFGPAFARKPEHARTLTAAALARAQWASSLVRSWLHCVASEAEARAGNGPASLRQADLAEAAYEPDEPVPAWFDFYNRPRLRCFAGYAAMAAGDHGLAADHLSRAVTELGHDSSKQRSVVSADLAAAHQGDADKAAHHLHEAIDALEVTWYRTGWVRVRETRPLLGDTQLGHQLDQRLAAVAGDGRR